jgi:hypothetical protein
MPAPAVNILVAARGHSLENPRQLGLSTIQRVETAIEYYEHHADDFVAAEEADIKPAIVMSGGYATMATGYRLSAPPAELREGSLMLKLASESSIPGHYLHKSIGSTTTLEVVLRPFEEGYFRDINPSNPLGIVTQETQWDRLAWFARKIFDLSPRAIQLIQARGEENPAIRADEQKLLKMTKILYGSANSPRGLRRAEHIAETGASVLSVMKLQRPPALRYLGK